MDNNERLIGCWHLSSIKPHKLEVHYVNGDVAGGYSALSYNGGELYNALFAAVLPDDFGAYAGFPGMEGDSYLTIGGQSADTSSSPGFLEDNIDAAGQLFPIGCNVCPGFACLLEREGTLDVVALAAFHRRLHLSFTLEFLQMQFKEHKDRLDQLDQPDVLVQLETLDLADEPEQLERLVAELGNVDFLGEQEPPEPPPASLHLRHHTR